jgi:hypothetical protein
MPLVAADVDGALFPELRFLGAAVWLNQGSSFAPQQRDTAGAFFNLNLSLSKVVSCSIPIVVKSSQRASPLQH